MNKNNLTKTEEIALHILQGLLANENIELNSRHLSHEGIVRKAISLAREFERQCPE